MNLFYCWLLPFANFSTDILIPINLTCKNNFHVDFVFLFILLFQKDTYLAPILENNSNVITFYIFINLISPLSFNYIDITGLLSIFHILTCFWCYMAILLAILLKLKDQVIDSLYLFSLVSNLNEFVEVIIRWGELSVMNPGTSSQSLMEESSMKKFHLYSKTCKPCQEILKSHWLV